MIKMDTPLNDGFICNKHNIGYKVACPSCTFNQNLPLSALIEIMERGQVAKARFAEIEEWYVTLTDGNQIRYCSPDGKTIHDLVPLTYSIMKAKYEIVSQ